MNNPGRHSTDLSMMEKRALLEQMLRKKVSPSRSFPLSYAQERLWFLDQWEPQSAAHNISSALWLRGNLHIKALERSLNGIVRRHEVLRTTFVAINGQPAQVVAAGLFVPLPLVDLRGVPVAEQETLSQHLALQEAGRPFDLSRGPLLRATLVRVNQEEHLFLLTMHHIISDGWSLSVFNRELVELYQAFCQERPSPLAALPVQYADYALWQRQHLQGGILQDQLQYWRTQLQGAPPLLDLPTDRPRPSEQTFAGATHQVLLPAELSTGLKTLSQHEGVTLFTTLLAALQTLLTRYSGQDDVSVGTYIAGRTRFELEPLIGFFINNLVLRADLSGDPSFRELLQRVSRVTQEAYAHQDVPFEYLLQELQPERHPSYTPFFQVMLVQQNMPRHELTLPGLTIQPLWMENQRANFDLVLWVLEKRDELYLTFEYNTDLFDAQTIQRMADHFQTLLHDLVAHPEKRLSMLSLLSASEVQQVLAESHASEVLLDEETSLAELVTAQAARVPDRVALVDEEEQLTYGDLRRRADQLASLLRQQGVGPEVPVGLCLERGVLQMIGLLGILQAGGAYVPLDPSTPHARLASIVQQSGMPLLLTQRSLLEALSALPTRLLCLDGQADEFSQEAARPFAFPESSPQQLAYVIYTSGSTGTPKGVAVEQRSLAHFTRAAARLFGVRPGERVLHFASLSFDASAEEIYPCLASGGTLVLRNDAMLASPAHFLQACQRLGLCVLDLPTAYWHELATALAPGEVSLPGGLRLVIIGGEAAQTERLAEWLAHSPPSLTLLNTYGPTEATVAATAHEVRQGKAQAPREASLIGRPLPGISAYVLDEHGQPVPPGIPGELYLAGPAVARGYLGRPELTAERFLPDPFSSQPGARLYRTGDHVRRGSDGLLEYQGRSDRQVKLRGFRIELGEIEAVLRQHPAVSQALVLLRQDSPQDQRLVAYVVPEQQPVNSRDLRAFLQQRVPSYMLPSAFVQLEAIPLTSRGKVDLHPLPTADRDTQEPTGTGQEPHTATEELLATIWGQVLQREQVDRQAHFFEMGGHSLLATQVVARVREVLGVELPLRRLFEVPILEDLARQIEQARRNQSSLRPQLSVGPRPAEVPLSYAQQRLWFLDQLQPASPTYIIALALRLSGRLQLAALQASLNSLVERHEALRTTFVASEGRPRQLIALSGSLPLQLVDLRALPTAEREAEMYQLARQEARRPFDLALGPLIRTRLIRLGDEEHVLLLSLHHIITDAWSTDVLLQELAALYRAAVQGEESHLSPPPLQYADYALWQQTWLEGRGEASAESETSLLEQQLAYWREHLSGAPPLLELPLDHFRPQVQTSHGAHFSFVLPPTLISGLLRLSQQEGATLFMTLLTAFAVLLGRWSGQDDMVVGTPIANRAQAETEGVLGFFVNMLALRPRLAGHLSIRQALRQVREVALEAYEHQDLPFERLVEALRPQRDLRYSPLFQVVFALQNVTGALLDLPGLTASLLPVESGIARFDLMLTMQKSEQGMQGVLEYNTDLFEPATIQRIAQHFQEILQAMIAQPQQRLDTIALLTPAERQQLLVEWNATRRPYPHDQGLSALFEEQVQRTPEAIALVFQEQQLTYGELNARANQLAHHLRHLGVTTEVLVGLYLERSLDLVVGLLAILKAGGAYVPLDLSYPQERLAFMLEDAGIGVLLTGGNLLARFPRQKEVTAICLDTDWPTIAQQSQQNPLPVASAEQLGYVIYTSGSTGQPKGVQVQQRSIARLVCGADYVPLHERQTFLQMAPVSFDAATFELWGALLHGARCVLFAGDLPTVGELAEVLAQHAISILWLTASLFNVLIDEAPTALAGLRHLLVGGEALSVSHVRRALTTLPNVQLINGYGPTENTTFSCCFPIEHPLSDHIPSIPIGRPIANSQVYVLDAQGQPVPIGVVGELYLGGAGLARGYLHRPELTAERFVPHPFSPELGARLYRTGDQVRWQAEGTLEFLGRADQQVKLRGFRIELGEIEAVLLQHLEVREAAVVLREDVPGDKRLVGYVVPQIQIQTSFVAAELRRFLGERLPDYMVPTAFVQMEELPLTSNGKLDRRALPAPESSGYQPDKTHAAARTPVENLLVQLWAQVLGVEQVGVHDNFFELGGDSILSIQIVARASAAGLLLTPRQLFQHQTIAQLATVVGSATSVQAQQEVVLGSVPLTPIQHWFFQQNLPEPQYWNQAILLETRQRLDPAFLYQAAKALLRQHDALRLRAQSQPGGWQLSHAPATDQVLFTQVDLTGIAETRQGAILEAAATALQASLDPSGGPLLRLALFDLGPIQPARLLLAIHHLAVDIVSWPILLSDLQTAYQQTSQGQPTRLPPKTTSYQEWAERLDEYAQSPAVRTQLDYWLRQPWQQVCPLPLDHPEGYEANNEASARTVVVTLTPQETQALLTEAPKTYHTQINEVLLTALVQACARWTGRSSLLVHLEGHGREDLFEGVDLSRTVGWFTSLVPLLLTLPQSSGPGEALKSVKETLRSVPQSGIGFGLLRYLSQDATIRERLAALPQPEVSFNYGGRLGSALSREEGIFAPAVESPGATHSPRGKRPHILDINSSIVEGQLYLGWTYSENLHQRSTIERLAQGYLEALRSLIRHCQSPTAGGYTPSDFPEAELSQEALDALIASLTDAIKRRSERLRLDLEAIYPLSPMQEGILFHCLYAPQSQVYFEQFAYTLQGDLDAQALKHAWQQVVTHHPILRTLFLWKNMQRPLQVVVQQVELPWREQDWRHLPPAQQDEELQSFLHADRAAGFDLMSSPLLRLSLVRLQEDTFQFTWSFHHLLLDGWSASTVLNQVFACYEAARQERSISLPASRPYRDYIAWLQRQDLGLAEAFWRQTLRGFTTPTSLESDQPHPLELELTGEGDYHDYMVRLSPTTTMALQDLARGQQLTLNTLVQGAWALLLSRYSGQADVLFGVTVSGRPAALPGVEAMVGLFINTLPLRARVDPRQPLLPWLHELQARQVEARQYEYSPLVQVQACSEVPRGQPLFETLLVFENYPVDASAVRQSLLAIRDVQVTEQTNYPLTVTVAPGANLSIRLGYLGSRFTHESIARMARHFQTLLQAMVAQPDQRLADLPLLTEAERQQLLIDWNATQTTYPREQGLAALFEEQVQRAPEAVALVYEGQHLTYGELNARANQLAHHLQQLGVAREGLVGLYLERSLDMVVGLLGILKAGGVYVPLDLSYPQERLAFMLHDAQISLLLTHQPLLTRFSKQEGVTAVCLDGEWPAIAAQSDSNLLLPLSASNLAYVIYTSGSTGQPKGVQVQQASVVRLVWGVDYVRLDAGQTLLHMAPVSFDAATFELWGALLHGGRCVLFPAELPGVQQLGEVLHREAVSTLWLTASLFNVVIDEAPQVLAGVRELLVGGEALSVRHVRRGIEFLPGVQLINGYGPTENTTFSCCYPIGSAIGAQARSIPIGKPIANTQAYVLDAQGQPVPVGVVGELYLGGAGLARGYLNRPELTAERFVPHPFSPEPGARLYRTGDQVRWQAEGTLEFLGRADQQVKLRGFRIELGEIEAVLVQHPLVREAVVVLRENIPGDKHLVAYIVAQSQQQMPFPVDELRHYLQARLPDYMMPAAFMLLEALPLTPNGKLDHRALPAPESSGLPADTTYVAPQTPTETTLAAIWAQVLGVEQVGIQDNFFELGGDSILSIQVVARATAAGLPLTPRQLFQCQTIAQLASVVGTQRSVQAQQELVLGSVPLLPIHHWFFQQALPRPHHWNQAILLETHQRPDPVLLRRAVQALLLHHDALRLRVQPLSEGWQLFQVPPDEHVPFTQVDLTVLPEAEQGTALEAAATDLQASLNLLRGPILRVALFELGTSQPARLLLAIHHLAVDIVSWSVLLEDLQTIYQQLSQGEPVRLPPKTTSFQHWAELLYEYAQSPVAHSQLAFWLNQPWQAVDPLPLDYPDGREANRETSTCTVVAALSEEETQALLTQVPQAYHTQINEVLLTALVQAFAHWTGEPSLLVHLEGHGREDLFEGVDLSRTVGWFTSLVPLLLTLPEDQGPGEVLQNVKEQVRSIPQHGIGFGLLRYLSQDATLRERLAALPQPQVSFNYAGRTASLQGEEGLFTPARESAGVNCDLQGRRAHVLEINGSLEDGCLSLGWTYSEALHRRSTIERLAQGYLEALRALIRDCQSPAAGGYTPSDFPLARLDEQKLRELSILLNKTDIS